MRIKQLDIYGYGKWVDQTFDLNDSLQIFYGGNEAGKSTLQSFIRSMLFGFPSRRRRKHQMNRFEPRHGDRYGGRMLLEDTAVGSLWLERTSQGLKLTDLHGETLPETTLDKILGGLDEELFDTFYSFDLQNLQDLANVGSDDLNDYFLSIGTSGSDQFLGLSKEFEKTSDEQYRRQAQNRPLNQLLTEYDELAEKVEEAKGQMERYDDLLLSRDQAEKKVADITDQLEKKNTERQDLEQLNQVYTVYLKDQAASRELDTLTFTEIPKQYAEELRDQQKIIDDEAKKLVQLEERQNQQEEALNQLTRYTWANNHEADRAQWLKETGEIKLVQGAIEQKEQQIQEAEASLEDLAREGQFYPDKVALGEAYELQIAEGHEIQAKIDQIMNQIDQLVSERNVYLEQRKTQQNNGAIARQQIAKLESQRVNDEEQLLQLTSLNHYILPALALILGVLALLYVRFASQAPGFLRWLGIGLIIFALLVGGYIFYSHRKYISAFQNSPILEKMDVLNQQIEAYQEQSKALGMDINDREGQIEQLQENLASEKQVQREWLVRLGFYETADPETVLKFNPVAAYFSTLERLEKYREEKGTLIQQVDAWKESIQPLLKRFPTEVTETRPLIRHVEETEAELKESQHEGRSLEDALKENKRNQEAAERKTQEAEHKIQAILSETESESLSDFDSKLRVNERIDELQKERNMYREQLAGHEAALAKVDSKQALEDQLKDSQRETEELRARLTPLMHEQANLMVEINRLEEDGSYQQLSQSLALKREELLTAVEEWGILRTSSYLINQTLKRGLEDPVPKMNALANEIFEKLTFGRYTEVKMNKKDIKVRQFSDVYFSPHELSQGTLEQLYVALRLAFIMNAKDMVSMPIMIDDAFVNFDDVRKTSIYQVIEDISQEYQILYFTFDRQVAESFKPELRIDLEEVKAISLPEEVIDGEDATAEAETMSENVDDLDKETVN